jgi:hypothetical protein
MAAMIDVECQDGVRAVLRITNDGDTALLLHNPGNYRPTEHWEFSREAYQVAVLRSFHVLEMTLRTDDEAVVEPTNIATRVDHIVGLPVELKPGADLDLGIPLHEFYDLKRETSYSLELTYGDDRARFSAATRFMCL